MAIVTYSNNTTAQQLASSVTAASSRQAECDIAVVAAGTGFIVKLYLGAAVRGTVTSLAPFTVGGSTDRRLIWPTFGPYAATGAPFGIVDTAEILTSAGVSLWKMPLVIGVVQDGCKPDFGPYPIVLGNPAKPLGSPPPGNTRPTIISGATFTVSENNTAIATLIATDAEGDSLTWSISLLTTALNNDRALVSISTASNQGMLVFNAGHTVAAPADVGADNIYNVIVRVTDPGGLFHEMALSITVAVGVFYAALGAAPGISKSTPQQMADDGGGYLRPALSDVSPIAGTVAPHPRVLVTSASRARAQAKAIAGDSLWLQLESYADASVAQGSTIWWGGKSEIYTPATYRNGVLCAAAYLATNNPTKKAQYLARGIAILDAASWLGDDVANPSGTQYTTYYLTKQGVATPGGVLGVDGVDRDVRCIKFGDESQGYGFRSILPEFALMLDWFGDGLSLALRQKVARYLMDWVEFLNPSAYWPAWDQGQFINWCNWPTQDGNNYRWANIGAMAIAVAASLGNDTRVGPISGPDRPRWNMDWLRKNWEQTMVPYFELADGQGYADGGGLGAVAYEQHSHLAALRRVFATAFTTPDTTSIPVKHFNEMLLWAIQKNLPGLTHHIAVGECKRTDSFRGSYRYFWFRMIALIQAATDPALIAQAWRMLTAANFMSRIPNEDFFDYSLILFDDDPSATRAANLDALPKMFFSRGGQFASFRDGPVTSSASIAWNMAGGRAQTRQQAKLEIFANGHVFAGSDAWVGLYPGASSSGSGLMWGGDYCSTGPFVETPNVGTSGYRIRPGYATGIEISRRLTPFAPSTRNLYRGITSDGVQFSTVTHADAWTGGSTSGYGVGLNGVNLTGQILPRTDDYNPTLSPVRTYLTRAVRKIVYLPAKKTFVILDSSALGDPADTRKFQWLSQGVPTITGQVWSQPTPSLSYDLRGRMVSSGQTVEHVYQTHQAGIGNHDGGYSASQNIDSNIIQITVPPGGPHQTHHVLQLSAKGSTTDPNVISAQFLTAGAAAHGRGVVVGDHAVVMGDDEAAPIGQFYYECGAVSHYVSDLTPSTSYAIRRQAVGGGADIATQNISTDNQGVLAFTTPGGLFRHEILSNGPSLSMRVFNDRITTTLASRRTANSIEWQNFVADCTLKIGAPSSYSGILIHWVAVYAKMENNSTHKTWVRDQVMALVAATSVAAITTGPNYNAAYGNDAHHKEIWLHICELAWSVDLCYEAFSAADRTAVAAIVNAYMDQWAKADQSNWAQLYTTASPNAIVNPSYLINNYMQNAWFAHAVAGVGSAGWNPRAGEWLTKAHQMRTVWQDTFSLAKYPNGRETEGSYYTPYMRHGFMALWILGEADAQQYLTAAEVKAQLNMTMFHMRPNLTDMHIGAQAAVTKGWFHPNKQYAIHTYIAMLEKLSPADAIVGHAATKLAQIQIDTFTDSNDGSETGKQFYEFFWGYDQVTPTSLATKTDTYLSTKGSQAVGTNKIYGHSGWNDLVNDVAFVVFANNTFSNPVYSHANPDAPGFQWYKGADQIVCDPEYFTNNGVGAEAGDGNAGVLVNNCVLPSSWINAATRRYNTTGDSTAPVIEQELSGSVPVPYRYVRINATNYYNFTSFDAARNCAMLRRCYVWLGATYKTVLIWDRVQTTGQSKRWQIHTTGAATIAGDVATWTAGATAARLRRLHTDGAPSAITDVNLAGTNMVPGPPEGTPYEAGIRRLEYSTSADDSRFFAVLDIDGNCTSAALGGVTNAGYVECALLVGGVSVTVRISDIGELVSIT